MAAGGRWWMRREAVVVTIFMLSGGVAALDAQAVFYLMPMIATDLGLNNTQIGLISTATITTWSLSGLAIGLLSDRLQRRKPFLVAAFLLFALLSGASALASGFVSLLIARLLVGVAEGPVIPLEQPIVMAVSAPRRRGFNLGFSQNFGAQVFGTLLAPPALVALAQYAGWQRTFLVAGIPGLLIAWLIWRFVPEIAARSPEAGHRREPLAAIFASMLRQRNVRLSLLITSSGVAWYFLQLSFLPLWLTRGLHLAPVTMSLVMAMVGAAGCVGSLVGPSMSDRIGRRPAMVVLAGLGAIAPLGALLLGAHPLALGACVFVGSLMIGLFPLSMSAVPMESVPERHGASVVALVICVGQLIGGLAGPAAGGMIADAYGLPTVLIVTAGFALVAAVAALGIRETNRVATFA